MNDYHILVKKSIHATLLWACKRILVLFNILLLGIAELG